MPKAISKKLFDKLTKTVDTIFDCIIEDLSKNHNLSLDDLQKYKKTDDELRREKEEEEEETAKKNKE